MLLLFSFLIFLNLGIGLHIYFFGFRKIGLFYPFIFIYLFYFLNYPLRAIFLYFGIPSFYLGVVNEYEIVGSLFFITFFILLAYYFFYVLFSKVYFNRVVFYENYFLLKIFYFIYFSIYIVSYFVFYSSGYGYALGDSFSNSGKGFVNNFISYVLEFNIFFYFLGVLLLVYSKNFGLFFSVIIMLFSFFFSSFVSSSKGLFIYGFIIILFSLNIHKIRVRMIYYLFFIFFGLLFSIYSYYVRFHGIVSGQFSIENLFINNSIFIEYLTTEFNFKYLFYDPRGVFIFERFNYLDAIILIVRNSKISADFYYNYFGSLVDLLGIVPSFLWQDKPFFNFGTFTSSAVWNEYSLSLVEMPIGRIGESFFLFNFGGIVIAPLLSYLIYIFAKKFLFSFSILDQSFYFFIFFKIILNDGWLFYNYRILIIGYLVYKFFFLFVNLKFKKSI